jgi:hypothetical protein
MRRWPVTHVLVVASVLASVFMAASGFFVEAAPLLVQRLLAGVVSAWVFVAGGLLAARLGSWYPQRSGLLLGVVYGGVGWGIVLSAWVVPEVLAAHAGQAHAWTWAWWWLALACGLATLALLWPVRFFMKKEAASHVIQAISASHSDDSAVSAHSSHSPVPPANRAQGRAAAGHVGPLAWQPFGFSLAAYACFGVGYIGYMTFVIALLREQGVKGGDITLFYALLGAAVVASARLWAGLLDRAQGGGALAVLNGLLGVATVLPALFTAWPLMLLSGVLFGAVFLSVVASTTALVRHNLPVAQWPAGISMFTIVFAAGQIFGPSVVGWIADGPGGLSQGLLISALALWVGALLAWRQRPLVRSVH